MIGRLCSRIGFTYIAALVMVVVIGILLGATGQSIKVVMDREREKELIFRGMQYRDAIERWSKKGVPLKNLKDLYEPTVSGSINKADDRLIRKLYKDPMTGEDFRTIPNPPDPIQGIYGVASKSDKEPYKQSNFPDALADFEGKKKYSEWEFVYRRTPPVASGSAGQQGQSTGGKKSISMPFSEPEGN